MPAKEKDNALIVKLWNEEINKQWEGEKDEQGRIDRK